MAVGNISSRTAGVGVGLVVAFLALAFVGIRYILTQSWGLIFELAYLLILLIVFGIVADRLFIR
ncbi:hypothetical protein [Natronorubrum halophilum]|uniref:hypothetical protein n=1 Tax=Natronorubrum halophilum TaxID=1702106 RepID=UPI0010C174A2|nr:hypothetical protein [Natronorubrum halophilum]